MCKFNLNKITNVKNVQTNFTTNPKTRSRLRSQNVKMHSGFSHPVTYGRMERSVGVTRTSTKKRGASRWQATKLLSWNCQFRFYCQALYTRRYDLVKQLCPVTRVPMRIYSSYSTCECMPYTIQCVYRIRGWAIFLFLFSSPDRPQFLAIVKIPERDRERERDPSGHCG